MANINYWRGLRQAGGLLLIAFCVRHCPVAIRNIMRLFIPNTLINTFLVIGFLGIQYLWRRNITLTSVVIRGMRKMFPIIRNIMLDLNLDIENWSGFLGFNSLTKMTKEIVLYYTLSRVTADPGDEVNYAWLISLLCNSIIGDSLFILAVEQNPSLYKMVHTLTCGLAAFLFMLIRMGVLYMTISLLYYSLLQDWVVNSAILKIKSYDLDIFEGLEKFYIRILTYSLQLFTGAYCAILLFLKTSLYPVPLIAPSILTGYIVCYPAVLGMKKFASILRCYVNHLKYFECATRNELEALNDLCAICLAPLHTARKTPCHHFFHGKCLLRSLRHRISCPICKDTFDIPNLR